MISSQDTYQNIFSYILIISKVQRTCSSETVLQFSWLHDQIRLTSHRLHMPLHILRST